jgi:hypothetical protein
MIDIHSLMKVADNLVPIEEFEGPIPDEDYIEGAIELTVDHKPILRREMIDYVDQLWSYLVNGLGEVVAGREFSTGYPDMPIDIVLQPQGDHVRIALSSKSRKWDAAASVTLNELLDAMVPAGILFFERLRCFTLHKEVCDRYISRLSTIPR